MKIAILSQYPTLYSTRCLKEAGEARGHEMRVIDYLRCYMNLTSHKPSVFYNGKPLENFDVYHFPHCCFSDFLRHRSK